MFRFLAAVQLLAIQFQQPIPSTQLVAGGLDQPLFVTHAPGDDDRIFVLERTGAIRIIYEGALLLQPFLDVDPLSGTGGEGGLLGMAFHPDYPATNAFFISYTNNASDVVISRYAVSENPHLANPQGDIVLVVDKESGYHNGGWIGFGPDGFLYVSIGDGNTTTAAPDFAQSVVGELLGNLLRIDVNGDDFPMDPNRDYAIPASNPFVDAEGEDEIWAYGFRNPWRCAFDRYVGSLYIADVGHTRWEEINVQPADSPGGEYYGWRCYEANLCTAFGVCDTDSPPDLAGRACTPSLQNCGGGTCVARSCCAVPYHEPVHAYSHSGNPRRCSITGGEVYRGCAFPQLDGTYFFADFCSGQIWGLRLNGGVPELVDYTALLEPAGFLGLASISSFGMDAVGELYICDLADGEVFKIVPAVSFQSCMTGPDDVLILPALCGSSASHLCSHQFDVDANLAVDLRDFQAWQNVHGQ